MRVRRYVPEGAGEAGNGKAPRGEGKQQVPAGQRGRRSERPLHPVTQLVFMPLSGFILQEPILHRKQGSPGGPWTGADRILIAAYTTG